MQNGVWTKFSISGCGADMLARIASASGHGSNREVQHSVPAISFIASQACALCFLIACSKNTTRLCLFSPTDKTYPAEVGRDEKPPQKARPGSATKRCEQVHWTCTLQNPSTPCNLAQVKNVALKQHVRHELRYSIRYIACALWEDASTTARA